MLKNVPSTRSIRRLNRRQRKKLHVGDFQELVFEVLIRFRSPLEEGSYNAFLDEFVALIESRHLAVGALGGRVPFVETDGIVLAWGRGSPTDEDRQAVVDWLRQHPEVAAAEAGEFVDAWYGWGKAA